MPGGQPELELTPVSVSAVLWPTLLMLLVFPVLAGILVGPLTPWLPELLGMSQRRAVMVGFLVGQIPFALYWFSRFLKVHGDTYRFYRDEMTVDGRTIDYDDVTYVGHGRSPLQMLVGTGTIRLELERGEVRIPHVAGPGNHADHIRRLIWDAKGV